MVTSPKEVIQQVPIEPEETVVQQIPQSIIPLVQYPDDKGEEVQSNVPEPTVVDTPMKEEEEVQEEL